MPEQTRRGQLAAEVHVLRRRQVRGEGQVLEDGLDAHVAGDARRAEVDLCPVEQDRAGVEGEVARQRLDQGGLAGAVVADQGDDLTGMDVEVGGVEGSDGTEASGQDRALRGWGRCRGRHRDRSFGLGGEYGVLDTGAIVVR